MVYKLQATVLLLDDQEQPQFAITRKYVVNSVLATVCVWEILDQTIENIIQSETCSHPISITDEDILKMNNYRP